MSDDITPPEMVSAIGINICACSDVSVINGSRPPTVVTDVSMTDVNRRWPTFISASCNGSPDSIARFKKSIRTIESLTTMPLKATMPKRLNCDSGCPNAA